MHPIKALLAALLLLGACSSPSIQYSGVAPVNVVISGIEFDVYSNGSTAQAIRLSWGQPDVAVFRIAVRQAIERATGCLVDPGSLSGDFTVIDAVLDCAPE